MNRPAFLFLCLLVGLWLGAAAVVQWAKVSTPPPVTHLGGAFIHSLKGENHA